MTLARAAILGASANWLGALAGFLIRFLINAILARLIMPQIFGEFALAFVFTELIGLAAAASPSQAIVQLEEPIEVILPNVLLLNAVLGLLVILISLAVYPLASSAHGKRVADLVVVLCTIRAFGIVVGTYESLLQRNLAFGRLAFLRILGIIVSAAGALGIAFAGRPLPALLAREGLPIATTSIVMSVAMPGTLRTVFRPSKEVRFARRKILNFCRSLFWVRMLTIACQRVDQLVITAFLGPSDLAFYWQAVYLAGLPNAGVAPATQTVSLRVFVSLVRDNLRLRRTFEALQLSVGYVLAIAAIFFIACPHVIVQVAFGPKWTRVADILPFLAPWMVLLPLSQNSQVLLTVLQRWSAVRYSLIAQVVVLLVAVPILVRLYGVLGAPGAILAGVLANQFILRRALDSSTRARFSTYKGILAASFAGAVVASIPICMLRYWSVSLTIFELVRAGSAVTVFVLVAVLVDHKYLREMTGYVWAQVVKRSATATVTK